MADLRGNSRQGCRSRPVRTGARRLRRFVASVALVCAAALSGTAAVFQAPTTRAPNIVVFLVDDLGWQDIQLPLYAETTAFNRRYRTPNLVRLAARGMTFTDAYAAAPVCTPTRVALLTGRSPASTHVTNWTQRRDQDTSAPFPLLLPPAWNMNGASPDLRTPHAFSGPLLPKILREAGYRTIHAGKAHWGAVGTPGADPHALGFDVNIGGSAAGQPGSYLGRKNYSSGKPEEEFRDVPGLDAYHGTDTFLTEALTIEATRAVDEAVARGQPFFLHFAHYAVHTPIETDERFVARYREAGLPPQEAAYASLIEGVDKSLGDVVETLRRLGVLENTIIIFGSDNGGLAAHSRAGDPHTQNAPLRSGKGAAYEGGIRVPLVIAWPGHTRPGSSNRAPTITDDVFPTLLDVARVPNAAGYTRGTVGRDLVPALGGRATLPADRPLVWHYPHFWGAAGPGIEPFSAIRSGRWKLIFFYAGRRYELYDLKADIGETTNLAEKSPAVASRLSRLLRTALSDAGAQMPIDPATRQPVALPPAAGTRASSGERSQRGGD